MTPQLNIPNQTSRGVISSLRPPCALNLALRYGYSDSPKRPGQVLVLPSLTEPVTAPGSGIVVSITRKFQTGWTHSAGELDSYQTLEVKIDHGGYVTTAIHGLSTVNVLIGQYVTRGDRLGLAKTTEIFFQLFYRTQTVDPATMSPFFRGYDGGKVPDKTRKLRSGPDFVSRALSRTMSVLIGGIRYFVDKYASKPELLINIDFNGDGSKTGPAQEGITPTDFWNVYEPTVFDTTSGYLCYSVLNPPLELVSDVIEETTTDVAFWSGDIIDTAAYVTESGTASATFLDGGTFQVIFERDGTEAGSANMTFLFGSTETIPEVDTVVTALAYSAGSVFETAYPTSGTDFGTMSVSFFSGSTFEVVVYAFGSYAPQDPVVYVESAGTSVYSFFSGSLFESVVYAAGSTAPGEGISVGDTGTASWAFISGGTETLVFPVEFTFATGGTVAFFGGTIHQF